MKKFLQLLLALAFLATSGTVANAQCTNTSQYGSATVNTSGVIVTISSCSYAGEFSPIFGAVAGQ
ncbi:MAG: hypothetical protein IPP17_19015, partial [Bacteroidetes bacterium]|nr:hypothetical protein [Bacteroidota bacterium]